MTGSQLVGADINPDPQWLSLDDYGRELIALLTRDKERFVHNECISHVSLLHFFTVVATVRFQQKRTTIWIFIFWELGWRRLFEMF